MEINKFKVRDVDELKKAMVTLAKIKGDNPEIANTDWGNPDDVFRVHQYVKEKGIKDETLRLLLQGAQKETLPNILFDVTLKDIGDIYKVAPKLFEVGYKPKDIHLVWILTDYEISVKLNKERERRVPDEIMLKTHTGAALTMTDILRNKVKGIGTIIDGSINVILGGKENTIIMTDQTIKGKEKFIQQSGEPIKRKGKYGNKKKEQNGEEIVGQLVIKSFKYITLKEEGKQMKSSDDFGKEMYNWGDLRKWVKSNIPKITKTRDIRRRKRI